VMFNTVTSDLSDLEDVTYDVLVFFSPEGIRSLYTNFPDFEQNGTRIAAFGNTTKKAIEEHKLRLDIAVPTEEYRSMPEALDAYVTKANKGK
jgi:uroporphyrinogen-III synthase